MSHIKFERSGRFKKASPVQGEVADSSGNMKFPTLPIKEAIMVLLQLEKGSPHLSLQILGESQAVLSWCLLTRDCSGRLLMQLDIRCTNSQKAELGQLLEHYEEFLLTEHPVWIEGFDYWIGVEALEKQREHILKLIAAKKAEVSPPSEESFAIKVVQS